MSRQTPRRTRQNQHARHPSNPRPVPTSDYDSEAAGPHHPSSHGTSHPSAPHPPHRSNTELNLGVLRRYLPSITSILSVAANAVIYTFDVTARSWDKSGVEGTLFVCALEPDIVTGSPRFCVFVLNRRGLGNLVLGLERVGDCEVTDDLLICALEDDDGAGGEGDGAKALGIWMHADGEDTRTLNMNIIRGLWEQVRDARRQAETVGAEAYGSGPGAEESVGAAVQAIGKQLTVDELFASQAAGGGVGG